MHYFEKILLQLLGAKIQTSTGAQSPLEWPQLGDFRPSDSLIATREKSCGAHGYPIRCPAALSSTY